MSAEAIHDTHSHVDRLPRPDAALDEARALGVERVIVPAIHPRDWDALPARDGVHVAIAIHPWTVADASAVGALDRIAETATRARAIAIGECGVDRSVPVAIDRQLAILEAHLAVARQLDLPVILHVVGATDRALALLARHAPLRGVVHGFTGALETALRFVALGLAIGIGPRVLDARARRCRDTARRLPIDALLLESDDAPPARTIDVARAIAALRAVPEHEVRARTRANAIRVLGD